MLFDVKEYCDRFSAEQKSAEDLFQQKRKGWGLHNNQNAPEARCDLTPGRSSIVFRGLPCICLWKRSLYGRTLRELKGDPAMPEKFGEDTAELILKIFGRELIRGSWALVTPPPRRHTEMNFAQRTGSIIAKRLGIPYYPDVANPPRTKQRINAVYTLHRLPEEENLIVYDDIITTGSTLISMRRLLTENGKNSINITSINNK